jgi:hypothetical protein
MKGPLIGGAIALVVVVLAIFLLVPSLLPSGLYGKDDGTGHTNGSSEIPQPEDLSPSADEIVFGPNVTLEWTGDSDADSYSIMITVPGSSIAAVNLTSTVNHYDLDGALSSGDYLWTVQAVEDGVCGPLSDVARFTVRTALATPLLQSPSDGSVHVNSVPTLRWGSVSDALGYRLQISSDNSFDDILVDVRLEGTAYGPTFVMEDAAVYSWRVSAFHGEAWSAWSAVRQFSHDYFLAAPMPATPTSGSMVEGDQLNLTWSTVEGADRYFVQVSASSDFSSIVANAEVSDEWYIVSSALDIGSTYYWRVQAVNEVTSSSWCATVHFSIAQDAISFSYTWTYGGRSWTLDGSVPGSDYYTLSGLARTYDYASYVMDDDPTVISVGTRLKSMAQANSYDAAAFILAFVQSLEYTNDIDTKGQVEYPRYPAETLVDGGGDCEDTSALYASLMQCSAVNVDAVLLMYSQPGGSGHMAVGIEGRYSGTYYAYGGKDFFYCETTGEGFTIGMFPSDLNGFTVEVLSC